LGALVFGFPLYTANPDGFKGAKGSSKWLTAASRRDPPLPIRENRHCLKSIALRLERAGKKKLDHSCGPEKEALKR
jgi:hypothetical protein